MKESDILYGQGKYWVVKAKTGGFEVFRDGVTHATRCAQVGFFNGNGLQRAKDEINRRINQDQSL